MLSRKAERFEVPALLQACGERLAALVPTLVAEDLVQVFALARIHKLRNLISACNDRIGAIGLDILEQDAVYGLLNSDSELYKEVLRAARKQRRLN